MTHRVTTHTTPAEAKSRLDALCEALEGTRQYMKRHLDQGRSTVALHVDLIALARIEGRIRVVAAIVSHLDAGHTATLPQTLEDMVQSAERSAREAHGNTILQATFEGARAEWLNQTWE